LIMQMWGERHAHYAGLIPFDLLGENGVSAVPHLHDQRGGGGEAR